MKDGLVDQVPVSQVGFLQVSHVPWDTVVHLKGNSSALHLHLEWSNYILDRLLDFLASHVGARDYSVFLIVLLSTDYAFDSELKDLTRAPHQLILRVLFSCRFKSSLISVAWFFAVFVDQTVNFNLALVAKVLCKIDDAVERGQQLM